MDSYQKNYCIDFGTPFDVDKNKWLSPNHAYTVVLIFLILAWNL